MARGPRWPRSASVWGGKRCRKSPVSRNQIPFLLGTTDSSLTSSTDRNSAGRWDDHASTRRSRIWWFAWHARIPASQVLLPKGRMNFLATRDQTRILPQVGKVLRKAFGGSAHSGNGGAKDFSCRRSSLGQLRQYRGLFHVMCFRVGGGRQ